MRARLQPRAIEPPDQMALSLEEFRGREVVALGAQALALELMVGIARAFQAGDDPPTAERLEAIHSTKTAALLCAAVVCGAVTANASAADVEKLGEVGHDLGLAFQIVDDVLDVVSAPGALGKTAGKDAGARKMTYPALYGIERARALAHEHIARARSVLATWPRGARLQALASYIETRLR